MLNFHRSTSNHIKDYQLDSSIISGLIGGLIAILVGYYVVKKNKNIDSEGKLYFGNLVLGIGVFCLLLSVFAFSAFFFDDDVWQEPTEFWAVTCGV